MHVLRGGRSCMGSGRHIVADAATETCGHPRERPRPHCASVKGVGRCHQRPLHALYGDRALGDGVHGGWVTRWGCEATLAEQASCYTRAILQFLQLRRPNGGGLGRAAPPASRMLGRHLQRQGATPRRRRRTAWLRMRALAVKPYPDEIYIPDKSGVHVSTL